MPDLRLLSSLAKVFADEAPSRYRELTQAVCMRNELFSFQAAWHEDTNTYNGQYLRVLVSGVPRTAVRIRRVESIPVMLACFPQADDDYLRRTPGLFPDALVDPYDTAFRAPFLCWQSAWIDINAAQAEPGDRKITVTLQNTVTGENIATASVTLTIAAVCLPASPLIHTRWFHCDSLAEYYNVSPLSEEHWQLIERYAALAASRGVNMLLTPIHTPPLDTEIGRERMTVQLVDIIVTEKGYTFGFDKLRRWVNMCSRIGIEYFEIAHFFSQWGAECAPKIVAYENGTEKRLFGWETPALSEEYTVFLKQYIPALCDALEEMHVLDRCWFHISDEPSGEHLSHYLALRDLIKPMLRGRPVMDALSNYSFYERGAVDVAIPSTDHIEPFIEHDVPDLWAYYCVGQYYKVSNCFHAMPSARTRIFGVQLYKFGIAGILQWGFNFWYSRHSARLIEPWLTTDGDATWPGGDPFIVYPGRNGEPVESLRLMLILEAQQDLRALCLLESLTSREHVLQMIDDGLDTPLSFSEYPRGEAWLLDFREKVDREILRLTAVD